MPRYFFHIKDGDKTIEDPEGTELPGLKAAREEALGAAREMLAERIEKGEIIDGQVFQVADAWGNTLLSIRLKSALRLS